MIAIVDYGMGNLRSVEKALEKLGHSAVVTSSPGEILKAERMILPGVGAFGAAMGYLNQPTSEGPTLADTVKAFAATGKPSMGICLGMQLLLTESEELGRHQGLDLVPGRVVKFDFEGDPALKIPHMGWNELRLSGDCPLTAGLEDRVRVYFVHSFYCEPADPQVTVATCEHGLRFSAALRRDNLFATQFHPEKSGVPGLRILDNFCRL